MAPADAASGGKRRKNIIPEGEMNGTEPAAADKAAPVKAVSRAAKTPDYRT
jgi:hypothetical protein